MKHSPDAKHRRQEEQRSSHVRCNERPVRQNCWPKREECQAQQSRTSSPDATVGYEDQRAQSNTGQSHHCPALEQHGVGVVAEVIEELIANCTDVREPPGFLIQFREARLGEKKWEATPALRQIAVLRLHAKVARNPVAIAARKVQD